MSQSAPQLSVVAFLATVVVGLINISTAVLAYNTFVPDKQPAETLVSKSSGDIADLPIGGVVSDELDQGIGGQAVASTAVRERAAQVAAQQPVRKADAPIVVGQKPLPTNVVATPEGKLEYKWCSGSNPALEDGICEAVISVAADPTESNPHLSSQAAKSLALLPPNSTLTIDESSWQSTSPTAGNLKVTLHTKAYGDINLLLFMEKQNGKWIVADGQIK